MDPISQGALGSIVAASCSSDKATIRMAALIGWAGGMLADADIFIRSNQDPLLNIEYHRHFSHALIFIPVGGLICAAIFRALFRGRKKFRPILLYATLGYATAGLLDACTSYGTQLLWPFSSARIAWNIISIIDPVFTLTILILLGFSIGRRAPAWSRIACGFALLYLGLGVWQNHRASALQSELVAQRGHHEAVSMQTVKPSIGNLVLWRSIYRYDGKFYVDAVRVGLLGERDTFEGVELDALQLDELKRGIPEGSVLAEDLKRFDHFSASYLAHHPDQPDVVADLRYSMVPNSALPLWGIRYDPKRPEQHVSFENFRAADPSTRKAFFRMLFGNRSMP